MSALAALHHLGHARERLHTSAWCNAGSLVAHGVCTHNDPAPEMPCMCDGGEVGRQGGGQALMHGAHLVGPD